MKIKNNQFNLLTILLICVSLVSVSCGGGSGGGGGGTDPGDTATITLSVSPNSIPANGESSLAVTVTLKDSTGAAVDRGTSVEFSTTLGTFPNEDTTYTTSTPTESGTVTVSLIAGTTEGTARITVRSNGITQTFNVEFTVQVVGSVEIASGAPQLLADGVSQTQISATVKDTDGHNMPDGTTVYFSTDLGTLSAGSAATTNGQATVTLTSSISVGTAVITATAAFESDETEVIFIPGDVEAISLIATPNNLTADGHSTSTIRATVTDVNGNLVKNGTSISFSVTTGAGTLSNNTGTTDVQTVSATTSNGVAQVTYTAPLTGLPDTETVRAEATNGTAATVNIVLIDQTIGSVSVSAGSTEIVADGFSTTTISATIKDLSGINVRDGIYVSFTTTAGTLFTPTAATVNGVATVTLRSPTNLGFAEVRATAGGVNDTITINFVPGAPFRITVLATPATVTAGKTSSIEAVVYDYYDNPVANGETLTFSALYGTFNSLTATTTGGTAKVTYTAPSNVPNFSIVTIRVETTNGRVGTTTITVTEPAVTGITLAANPTSLPADGSSQSSITATVTVEGGGSAPDGTGVNFSITSGGGSITPLAMTVNGTATAILTSGSITGTATIRAQADNVSATIDVDYVPTPDSLSLSRSNDWVSSDNSDTSTITALVLDSNFTPVEGIAVAFSLGTGDVGQLSSPSGETDENGEATIKFSSGTQDRSNREVYVVATVSSLSEEIPVLVTGTTLTLSTNATNLEVATPPGPSSQATLVIEARDAGANPISGANITMTSNPAGIVQISDPNPGDWTTNVSGRLTVTVTALNAGDTTVMAQGLGTDGIQGYTVGDPGNVFTILSVEIDEFPTDGIFDPLDEPYSASTSDTIRVTVQTPGNLDVQFATTLGLFDNGVDPLATVVVATAAGELASADLTSSEAGTAQILVNVDGNSSISDSATVYFYADIPESISLQASATVVPPSIEQPHSVTLQATVKNGDDQVVGDVPVAFFLEDTTGGGEYVSPPVVYTNQFGIAESMFVSGFLGTDAQGVTVKAMVVGVTPVIEDSIQIIIGGTPSSVTLGRGSTIYSVNNDTAYRLPMSVQVNDSNGNPMEGQVVTLNVWPYQYTTGDWSGSVPCGPVYDFLPPIWYNNEDDFYSTTPGDPRYRNLELDDLEDTGTDPGHGDGQLTPPLSAAGTVPATVITDENGVGTFDLVYLKSQAAWIRDEVTATVVVSGTETKGTLRFVLPYADNDACNLAESPYND